MPLDGDEAVTGQGASVTVMEIPAWEDVNEHDPVFKWRATELEKAGYTQAQAIRLAADVRVDLHHACELVRAVIAGGGSADTAFDIEA